MRFDDRLLTVLNQPADDRHDAAVRWRQLVDLVARAGANSTSEAVNGALEAIKNEAPRVDETLRAAAARAVAALPLPFALLEYFAGDTIAVSAPVLASASLDEVQWSELHAVANEETKAFIATIHPSVSDQWDRSPPQLPATQPHAAPDRQEPYVAPALKEVVQRIEERRRTRGGAEAPPPGFSRQPVEPPALFRWECGPSGEIAWVEGAPRGALIGRSITNAGEIGADSVDQEVTRAFGLRSPFRDGAFTFSAAGTVTGDWKVSGIPAFDPVDGRFAGYRGVALRETAQADYASPDTPDAVPEVLTDPASLRELVHEIKTPLNAIIGFAEIIEGQYLGPADRGYRTRASEIVRQSRLLLTAVDDLDFAAKLRSSGAGRGERVDLAGLLDRQASQLQELASRRGQQLAILRPRFDVPAKVEPELADRLLFRLFGTLSEMAANDESLQIWAELSRAAARILISRPEVLRAKSDDELMGTAFNAIEGTFMLRLTRGLARICGGDLVGTKEAFALVFPTS